MPKQSINFHKESDMSEFDTIHNVSADTAIDLLQSWLDSDESNTKTVSESERLERENNTAVFPITVKGFGKAFAKLTRRYNANRDVTRVTLTSFAYDAENKRVSMGKRSLSLVANGNKAWQYGDTLTSIVADNWRVGNQAMSPKEIAVIVAAVRKANSPAYHLWGKNAARDYIAANRSAKTEATYTA
jgi:hypothetical protein